MTYVTTKYKKVVHVEETPLEEKTRLEQLRKQMAALKHQIEEAEKDKKRRGYCPDCHVLLSVTGKCNKCGTIWKFHTRGEHIKLNIN